MGKKSLINKIRREFPDLKWQHAQHIVEGWDHYVLKLDDKYIFRFPRKVNYAKRLYGEVLLLKYLSAKKLPIPVPRYEFVAKDKSFAGYSILEGDQMRKVIFDELTNSAKITIAKQIGSFLSILHTTPLSIGKKFGARQVDSRKQYKDLVKNTKKYIKPRLSKKDNALVDEFLKDFGEYQGYPHKCLTHSDIYRDHLIVDKSKKRLSGIIDFADRSIADPAWDFSELWTYGKKFVEEVYKNYTGPKDKDFLHRSQLYCKRVPLWVMISPFLGTRGTFALGRKLFKEIYLGNLFDE